MRFIVGLVALGLLLVAEVTVILWVRHLTIRGYLASRDPVAGTAYLVTLGLFAVMPLLVARRCDEERTRVSALLDGFIPKSDVRTRHQIIIHAPAGVVFETLRDFDLQSIFVVRVIFWLRSRVLGAKTQPAQPLAGLIAEMLNMGWTPLAEEANWFFVGGAACQPWQANVAFSPIPPDQFAAFAEGDRVKIAWSLETEARTGAHSLHNGDTPCAVARSDAGRRLVFRSVRNSHGEGMVILVRHSIGTSK
jgi:hypothetical protein